MSQPSIEAEAFLERVVRVGTLDDILASSISEEAELRRLFATDRNNRRLSNPYVGLVDIFDAPVAIRTTKERAVKENVDLTARYILPLKTEARRKDGDPCVVGSLEDFKKNWAVFTEGSLSQLADWNNVVAAGGSVLACLLPLPESAKESKRNLRKYFHSTAYPTSDVDIFLWGLTPEQAEVKINAIFEAVRDSVPWEVTCVRTKHAISIHSQYPYRSVQIVLRLYASPAEILAGFDVDAPCVAYDGRRILANPRAAVSLMRQCNTVDMTRRSPSYEIRLAKYASRGFEVYVPDLRRADIDPTIFERSINRIEGLARLLVLEKLADPLVRTSYLESRRLLRGRPSNNSRRAVRRQRKYKGDLKSATELGGLQMNDYDVASLHIPYGPGWTAKRIDTLVYQTDLGMNSTFNPKNKDRKLHRHCAFFGTLKECIEDCCGHCPQPRDDEEKALEEEERKHYIHGRISFMEEDPGRQTMTGSFNPIDVGEWSAQAYIGETERFFALITAFDRTAVQRLLIDGVDVNRRDHVGRAPLHVAILVKAIDIAADLIDAGARMTARLVDGRTCLHLAAQHGLSDVVRKLLARSAFNATKAEEASRKEAVGEDDVESEPETESDVERPSSEDDWSSEEEDKKLAKKGIVVKKKDDDPSNEVGDIPEDNDELPDVLDINAPDWDFAFNPLVYAIISGSVLTVDVLLAAGADAKIATKSNHVNSHTFQPLHATILMSDEGVACTLIERLIRAGATTSQADDTSLFSVFHSFVAAGKRRLVSTCLQADPNARIAVNVPSCNGSDMVYPLVSAIANNHYGVAVQLLAHGALIDITAEDLERARQLQPNRMVNRWRVINNPLQDVFLPAEVSIAKPNYLIHLLAECGVPISVELHQSMLYPRSRHGPLNLLGWVQKRRSDLKKVTAVKKPVISPKDIKTWADYKQHMMARLQDIREKSSHQPLFQSQVILQTQIAYKAYLEELELLLNKNVAQASLPPREGSGAVGDLPSGSSEGGAVSQTFGFTTSFAAPNTVPKTALATVGFLPEISAASPGPILYTQQPPDLISLPWASPTSPKVQPTGFSGGLDRINSGVNPAAVADRQKYEQLSNYYVNQPIPEYQFDQYDALFEACWAGDATLIQELCLPTKTVKETKPPIQITVQTAKALDEDRPYEGSFTPFAVAILARKWDIARLVLAIATAQYQKPEERKTFTTTNIALSEHDSDPESDDEDDSDLDDDDHANTPPTFTDVASRPSTVKWDVSPNIFFDKNTSIINHDGTTEVTGNPFMQAIINGDLEAFTNLCDLYKLLPSQPDLHHSILPQIMLADEPDIFDDFIRRTGTGLELEVLTSIVNTCAESDAKDQVKESKIYLGLSVHGVKRKDLATRGDEHRPTDSQEKIPLLWVATQYGAKKIVQYLASSGSLAAYRHYAQTSSSDRAATLRKVLDLEERLPGLIGVLPNARNETALTAAILTRDRSNALPLAKLLLATYPDQAQAYLHSTIHYLNYTPLLLAVAQNCEPDFADFLLANGVSPDAVDHRGWNVLHLACVGGSDDLLRHLLKKLSPDTVHRLLVQKTFRRWNTPLMVAVKRRRASTVEHLLNLKSEAVKESLLIRDANGSLPLHIAARDGLDKIAKSLVSKSPATGSLENAVGETPLDVAATQWLLDAAKAGFVGKLPLIPSLALQSNAVTLPHTSEGLAAAIQDLHAVKAELEEHDTLLLNPKLREAINSLITFLEKKQATDSTTTPGANDMQTHNYLEEMMPQRRKTYDTLLAAAHASSTRRQLVHLSVVQQSVLTSTEENEDSWRANRYVRMRGAVPCTISDEEMQDSGILQFRVRVGQDFTHGAPIARSRQDWD